MYIINSNKREKLYFSCFNNITVMLSDFIKERTAYFDSNYQHLTLSFTSPLKIDLLEPRFQKIRILNLSHCGLNNLEGIQQFKQLEQLNIKQNCITEVSQIYRIVHKDKITRLEFMGNDIEYLGAALFINLVRDFPNLIELNGKNYYSIIHKNRKHKLEKIIAHSHKIQKEMERTLKREEYKLTSMKKTSVRPPITETDYIPTETREKTIAGINQCELQEDNNSDEQFQNQIEFTSKKQQKSAKQYSNHQCSFVQNMNISNKMENDVSLGDISNIPLTKSIRGSYVKDNLKQNRKKGLEIFTLNESLHGNKLPLSQPTATFAMQIEKEKESQPSFVFRNHRKYQSNLLIEQYLGECERPTKRCTYGSGVDEEEYSDMSSQYLDNSNIIYEQKISNYTRKKWLAEALVCKNLLEKAFYSWKNLPCEKNFPMKSHVY